MRLVITTGVIAVRPFDICPMSTLEQITLTPEQERFAKVRGVILCTKAGEESAVCLYSDDVDKTVRWIVDRSGRVLERTEFDRL